ncbi:sporulation membrane protein YtaF [Oceanobacillus alkalisoli]|uniref:sporulation membrane protein YtaF n=1 Tax=Oceanobacillus alkalisoli TaxID=2925113 RepID=UPI001EE485AE|nr:sporulation membrane protein YtaF [Oceanobacillus alkalisoli]MCG5102103.1 sporulation membrane protein YtaF [Oceanobacillus alkalisoli]
MLYYTGLFLLIIAVSLDGLGVGISYGIQKTRVPILAISIIMLCSGVTVFAAMSIGEGLKFIIPSTISENAGAMILISLGIFTLYNIIRKNKVKQDEIQNNSMLTNVKKVFRSPKHADLDRSGTISKPEAILLGMALSLDAFGAGFAASLMHYSAFLTAGLIAVMSGIFLIVGLKIGMLLSKYEDIQFFTLLPSLLLIGIGLFNLLT